MQTDRHADIEAEVQTDRLKDRLTSRLAGRLTGRQAGRPANRRADRLTHWADRQTYRLTGRQVVRQADRQTHRLTGKTAQSTAGVYKQTDQRGGQTDAQVPRTDTLIGGQANQTERQTKKEIAGLDVCLPVVICIYVCHSPYLSL